MLSLTSRQELLNQRYWVQNSLSNAMSGREYLVLDAEQCDKRCLLKEVAIDLNSCAAKRLRIEIQRRLILLYQLQHPQILSFRAVFEHEQRLFLVQDYIEGKPYRTLLQERLSQNQCFSELEVLHLCMHLLPVLAKLHKVGIIHRNVCPDSLLAAHPQVPSLAQSPDRVELPILTNFSAALSDRSESLNHPSVDLYGLGMTCLELLTGKAPQTLLNEQGTLTLDPALPVDRRTVAILKKMVAVSPKERYQSVSALQSDLQNLLAERSLCRHEVSNEVHPTTTICGTRQPQPMLSRLVLLNLETVKALFRKSKEYRTTISIGASLLALLGVMSLMVKPTLPHANDGVWIAGIRVSQAEASTIISSPEPDPIAITPTVSSSAYFNRVIETDRTQPTELDFSQLPLTLESTLQTTSQVYRITPEQAQQITITLHSADVKMAVVPASPTNTIQDSSSHWSGNIAAGEPCIIRLTGSGSFVLSMTESSAQ